MSHNSSLMTTRKLTFKTSVLTPADPAKPSPGNNLKDFTGSSSGIKALTSEKSTTARKSKTSICNSILRKITIIYRSASRHMMLMAVDILVIQNWNRFWLIWIFIDNSLVTINQCMLSRISVIRSGFSLMLTTMVKLVLTNSWQFLTKFRIGETFKIL